RPREYEGNADSRDYMRFMKESIAYIRDSHIPEKRACAHLSHFMSGPAYDFYVTKVSLNEEKWTLKQFFTELFNYCFPLNYRIKLREKLRTCVQGNRNVSTFSYELEELLNMIGTIDERTKVHSLWNGFRQSIQRSLWRNNLNPEISSWEEV
ncbi:hypothetical protein CPC08DRAFT_613177, partial [Agrocybe pediades]